MQKPFSFLYGTIPLLGRIQFPYRLLSLITLFTALMSGILVMATKRKHQKLLIISLVILAVIPTILNWSNRGFLSNVNDDYLMKVLKEKPSEQPALDTAAPKWFPEGNFWQKEPAKNNLEIVSGKGDIIEIKMKTNEHEYVVNAQTDISLRENTYYFPGWELTVNNIPKDINYLNPKLLGIINFDLKKGLYSVKLKFIDTPIKKVSNTISLLGILLLVLYASGIITKSKIR